MEFFLIATTIKAHIEENGWNYVVELKYCKENSLKSLSNLMHLHLRRLYNSPLYHVNNSEIA